jgi:DNA-binding phage protein
MDTVKRAIQQIQGAHKRRTAILRRVERGERVADIAKDMGLTRQRIYAMLKRARELRTE